MLAPIRQIVVSILIYLSQITGPEPALLKGLGCLVRLIKVSWRYPGAFEPDFTLVGPPSNLVLIVLSEAATDFQALEILNCGNS